MASWSQCTRSAPVEGYSENKNVFGVRLLRPPRCCSSVCSESATKNVRSYIYAIDRLSTKLRIPLSATEPTQALQDDGLVPGLCRLYLEGRCRQGDLCHQVHANPNVVETIRQEALHAPSCCHMHGARCNFESFPLGLTFTLVDVLKDIPKGLNSSMSKGNKAQSDKTNKAEADISEMEKSPNGVEQKSVQQPSNNTVISIHSLCPTTYLWTLYSNNISSHIYLPKNKICREHRKGLCRFGDECNFLHVCREIPIDSSVGSDGVAALHSPSNSSMLLHLDRSSGNLQPDGLDASCKWHHSRQIGLAESLNQEGSLIGSFASFNENEGRQLTPEHVSLYNGMHTSQSLNGRSEPLLRPSSLRRASTNLTKSSVSHNPYSFSLR
ncbi:unnamed protein product [Phytomonas sp. EM1]|nr:unnamed protein product [Phytomonas sp. EM1]|eukprot:CCW61935.1 unnamed protein product [Phytomonas sp. isolate EM1]